MSLKPEEWSPSQRVTTTDHLILVYEGLKGVINRQQPSLTQPHRPSRRLSLALQLAFALHQCRPIACRFRPPVSGIAGLPSLSHRRHSR